MTVEHVDLEKLYPNPYQPETRIDIPPDIARKFGISIIQSGLILTPVGRKHDKPGYFEVGDGWIRRSGFLWIVKYIAGGESGPVERDRYECYKLVPAGDFEGQTVDYHTADHDVMRNQKEGAYHRLKVKLGKEPCVLIGPKVVFLAPKIVQTVKA